jgi:hypothetical protein
MSLERLIESLEPLVAHLDVRCLARLASSCHSLAVILGRADANPLWSVAASATGLVEAHNRAAVMDAFQRRCIFDRETAFGAQISGWKILLELGSGTPASRRVAAANSMASLCKRKVVAFDVSIEELEYDAIRHHVILWLGVLINHRDARALDSRTLPEVLQGYDSPLGKSHSMLERFASSGWSMSVVGSNSAVWSAGVIGRLLGPRLCFGTGDRLRLVIDNEHRQLRIRVNNGPEVVAVRRLWRRSQHDQSQPVIHAVAHLSDLQHPQLTKRARAVLRVGEFL